MTVTEESGGRLNAFAKEPEMEIINQDADTKNSFQRLILPGLILLFTIIGFSLILK